MLPKVILDRALHERWIGDQIADMEVTMSIELSHAALPYLKATKGSIVNISSAAVARNIPADLSRAPSRSSLRIAPHSSPARRSTSTAEWRSAAERMIMNTNLADEFEIQSLIARFSDATNHHEWNKVESFFTEDAVWEAIEPENAPPNGPPMGFRFDGVKAIRASLARNVETIDLLFQTVTPTAVVLVLPDRATSRSTLSEVLRLGSSRQGVHVVGTYSDELVKRDGQWRFAHRTFRVRYVENVEAPERLIQSGT